MAKKRSAKLEGSVRAGRFKMPNGEQIPGVLTFDGTDTELRLDHDTRFQTPLMEHFDLHGEFSVDRRKVSLLRCVTTMGLGTHSGPGIETTYSAEVGPNLVMIGNHHISSNEKVITRVYFLVDDAVQLFYDYGSFGSLVDAKPYIDEIANANHKYLATLDETEVKERVVTGDQPIIVYYTGKSEICSVSTSLGTVAAENHPSRPLVGGPSGVAIKNAIYSSILFPEPVDVQEATWRAVALVRLLELCAGRPQNMLNIGVLTTKGEHDYLELYWPRRPYRRKEGEIREKPWAGSILLDPIRRCEEYDRVVPQWLGRHKLWEEARMHFFTCMHDQQQFGPARITAAANMFDLIPPASLPPVPPKQQFNTLKTNILHRAKIVTDDVPGRFPELEMVIDEAVKCRKRYIHARQGTIEYKDHFGVVVFLTQTLEFLFAASDLIECGWSLKNWLDGGSGGEHPFSKYAYDYQRELGFLKKTIAEHGLPQGDT